MAVPTQATDDPARRELARGTLELVILSLLAGDRRYGYELMTAARQYTDGALEVKEGTLYPILHRLEDGGYVEATWDAQGRTAPRKYYKLTKTGTARLKTLRAHWDSLVGGIARLIEEVER